MADPIGSGVWRSGRVRKGRATGRVRLEDVARLAEVSAQTVSRFLRDPERVAGGTADRIRAAIWTTGYVPNLVAGSLASNRSGVVAILVPTLENPAHAAPVEGLSAVVGAAGYQVLVGRTGYDRAIEDSLVRTFLGRRVDGLVLTGGTASPLLCASVRKAGVPTVQLWELPRTPLDMVVGFSNHDAGAAVAAHFAARGYRRPVVLASSAGGDTRSAGRAAGFAEEAGRLGLDPPDILRVDAPVGLQSADTVLDRILAARPRVDAAFAVGDQIAVAVALACQRRKVAVPAELAIAGFGDVGIAEALVPPLTTVRIDRRRLGEVAGELLLARLKGEEVSHPIVDLGFELVVREST